MISYPNEKKKGFGENFISFCSSFLPLPAAGSGIHPKPHWLGPSNRYVAGESVNNLESHTVQVLDQKWEREKRMGKNKNNVDAVRVRHTKGIWYAPRHRAYIDACTACLPLSTGKRPTLKNTAPGGGSTLNDNPLPCEQLWNNKMTHVLIRPVSQMARDTSDERNVEKAPAPRM